MESLVEQYMATLILRKFALSIYLSQWNAGVQHRVRTNDRGQVTLWEPLITEPVLSVVISDYNTHTMLVDPPQFVFGAIEDFRSMNTVALI